MVEVFNTNVQDDRQAAMLLQLLAHLFPNYRITFDLEDCDNILRIAGDDICPKKTIALLYSNGFKCEVLN